MRTEAARNTRRKLLSEWRRHEVLDAVRRIFARLGYAAVNVEKIAKEAGMAKGTIYLYFKSKEEIIAAVIASDANRMIKDISDAKTFEERLTVFLNQYLAHLQSNKNLVRIAVRSSRS